MKFKKSEPEFESTRNLVIFASYEDRCLQLAKQAIKNGFSGSAIIYLCKDAQADNTNRNLKELKQLFNNDVTVIHVEYSTPIPIIHHVAQTDFSQSTIVDISCFNRENLFAFFWASRFGKQVFPNLLFAYTWAENYGPWLSRDYGDPHNIIGFGGSTTANRFRHLICCVGFESERALEIVHAIEPSSLTLALGTSPAKDKFLSRNQFEIQNAFGNQEYDSIELNIADPEICLNQLKQIVDRTPDDTSIHIAPFNNKISCLAIFALWAERNDIRVWNAQPTTYNMTGYSEGAGKTEYFGVEW